MSQLGRLAGRVTVCWEAVNTLPCDAGAPEQARRFVVRALSRAASAAHSVPIEWRTLTEDAELVVSELTTNALRADCSELEVGLELHRGELVVTVRDDAGGWPRAREASPTDPSGRGLHLVGAVTERWGSTPTGRGKTVWATLPVPESCSQLVECTL
jgi:hypothetical protein